MAASLSRIWAVFLRYLYLHQRSVSRVLEIFFWPVMELLVWGFLSSYIKSQSTGPLGDMIVFLISAMIFWDVLYRSQQGVSISIIEDIWTHNILNILISPLKIWEWLAATFLYGFLKTMCITVILGMLASVLYHFHLIDVLGFYLIPFIFNLLFFGWALGVFTSGLLIRWGHAVEALIWGIPFLIQPLSAIFYPLSVLPPWAQKIAVWIPSTHVFEGMRATIAEKSLPMHFFYNALLLNLVYFVAASLFFSWMFRQARATGRLGRLGLD